VDALAGLGVRLYLYSDRPIDEGHQHRLADRGCEFRVSGPMRYFLWEQRWLPRQCAADSLDVLHCPFHFGLPWRSSCARVLTLHDAIDRAYCDPVAGWKQRCSGPALQSSLYQWIARTKADQVITVSEHSKRELATYFRIPAGRITVAYLAADSCFHEAIPEDETSQMLAALGLRCPYFLYVGGFERRKNVSFLLRAFAAAGLENFAMVLAGTDDGRQLEMLEMARSVGVAERVHLPGVIKDRHLAALYTGASAFVYPSEQEGFGLPLCEAMAAGCPILAARATSLPEVLGAGGETFSLAAPDELASLMRQVAGNAAFREDLAARAKARSEDFSWRRTAEQTVAVYRRALEEA
jgi:glycosyltransferase involved in cell wall biosynthesis